MRFVAQRGGSTREVEALLHDPDATVADLLAALEPDAPPGATLWCDGKAVPSSRRADRAGIRDGSTVSVVGPLGEPEGSTLVPVSPAGSNAQPAVAVAVVGGLDAGRTWTLTCGPHPVGRGDGHGDGTGRGPDVVVLNDPSVSERHAELMVDEQRVTVADCASHNGTWITDPAGHEQAVHHPVPLDSDTTVRMGATQLRTSPVEPATWPGALSAGATARHGQARTVSFNRPPRTAEVAQHEPLDPPATPAEPPSAGAVGVVAVLAPLLMAVVMVKVLGNLMFGLFALLSPILLIGGSIESRRRRRRMRRRSRVRFGRDLNQFAIGLDALITAERRRLDRRLPDLADTVRRAEAASTRLWERRPDQDDFLALRVGTGPVQWAPPCGGGSQNRPEEVRRLIEAASVLSGSPVEIDAAGGAVIGLIGPRSAAMAVARSLVVQTAVHHGPSDVAVAVLTSEPALADWSWATWLPHTAGLGDSTERLLAAGSDPCDQLLRSLLEHLAAPQPTGPTLLLVLDHSELTLGRRSPARSLLRHADAAVTGLVVAEREEDLPALCSVVVQLTDDLGSAAVRWPGAGRSVAPVLAAGLSLDGTRRAVRALAGFDDPELGRLGAGLPTTVDLLALLTLDPPEPEELTRRWKAAGADPSLVAPIGVGDDGVLAVDLVRDGPHALVAGTTGAGKSELLRTLVAGLAASSPPDLLTFVLIDFKGGSAFDACAGLPHTVGLVTDLDEHLGARALRCLEAELRHRERLLRSVGASDLTTYRARQRSSRSEDPAPESIARLVVVIDEFATLAAELPDFVDPLVSIAQRGRSLGVHLVLATQRPTGAVSDHIRANTNLRVALRVQDEADSLDVVGIADAASLSRTQPGRALVRLGPGEVLAMQTALVTNRSTPDKRPPVEVIPLGFGGRGRSEVGGEGEGEGETALSRLAQAASQAFLASGRPPPRQPWPAPLPRCVDLLEVLPDTRSALAFDDPAHVVAFVLADDPEGQRQHPGGWAPAQGNLLLTGLAGSGTTTAITSLALAIAATRSPDRVHIYAVDFGARGLDPLAGLPHVGAVIAADELERQARLVRFLQDEIVRRRAATATERQLRPRLVLLLDGLAGFRAAWPDSGPVALLDDLVRVLADGPELGVFAVLSAERVGAAPASLAALITQKLVFRLGDPADYAVFGLGRADVPAFGPGTAVWAGTAQEVQVAVPSDSVSVAVRQLAGEAGGARTAVAIGTLPRRVPAADLAAGARVDDESWWLPVGVAEQDLQPAGLTLYPGDHALVAGPGRSGRTSALSALAMAMRQAEPAAMVVAITDHRRSWLGRAIGADLGVESADLGAHLPRLLAASRDRHLLILVDDAERVDDVDGALTALVEERSPYLHVVAAGLAEPLRSSYTHWSRRVRASRTGLLLQPDPDLDGDLLGVRLPRHAPAEAAPGRGWLVQGGIARFVQTAGPNRTT